MKAPRRIRHVVDRDGKIVSSAIDGRAEATRVRNRISMESFGGHPFAIATYVLQTPELRAVITLSGRKKKP